MRVYLNLSKIHFSCVHCGKKYSDHNDKYLNRCNKNKDFCTTIKCDCGKQFRMSYNIEGHAVSWS